MLKGSRDAVLHRVQPISIHGQLSYDLHYTFADEPDSQMRVARVGSEVLSPGLQDGDRVRLDFLVGVVTGVHRNRMSHRPMPALTIVFAIALASWLAVPAAGQRPSF